MKREDDQSMNQKSCAFIAGLLTEATLVQLLAFVVSGKKRYLLYTALNLTLAAGFGLLAVAPTPEQLRKMGVDAKLMEAFKKYADNDDFEIRAEDLVH